MGNIFRYPTISYTLAAALVLTSVVSFGSTGMEVTILLPLLVIALTKLEQSKPWHASSEYKKIFVLALILSLAELARLDAVFLIFMVLLLVLLTNHVPNNQGKLLALGLFPIARA